MAQSTPFGFQAGQSRRSVNEYYVASSDTSTLAVGDPVKTNGNVFVGRLPDSRQSSGMLHVTKAASGDSIRGVIVGIAAGPGDNSAQSIPGTKTRAYTVLVNDNPQALWDVQADNTAPLSAMAGMYAAYTVGAPLGSVSSTVVDASSIGSTISDLLIAEVLRNDGANSLLRVAFVQHEMAAAGGSPQIGAQIQSLVSTHGIALQGGPTARPRLLIIGNSIAGQSCRSGATLIGAASTLRVATNATNTKAGSNQLQLRTGDAATLAVNDYICVLLANQQPWPVQITAISTDLLTLAKRLPFAVRSASGVEAGVVKVTAPVLFGGTWRQTFGIHNYANALAGGLFEVVPGYGHGSATADEIIAVLPQHLQFYRPAVVMMSLFENSIGSGTAAELTAMADRAAGLCLAAGARPIVLHTLPTTAVGSSRADEYDDLRTAIINIGTRVPGAIGLDPGSIYLDTSDGTNPRRPLSGWTDGVVHPLESKRATIAWDGGLVTALQSCAQGQTVNIGALLYGANPTMAGTGGTAGAGTTGTVAASTTISCAGTGLSAVASKNTDDSQRIVGADAGAITAGSEFISVAQALTLPTTWNLRTRLKIVAEVTISSHTNLGALRLSTAFGTQSIDMRTSASSSDPFDTALVGRKVVLESMAFPMLDPATTSATVTLDFRTLTGTGFAVDATVHNMGFALASIGELDDGAISLL